MSKLTITVKIEQLATAATLDGTELVELQQGDLSVKCTTQDIAALGGGGGAAAYLVYTALLSQSGTDAPVATVLQNTLGGTPVWTRDGVGQYLATLAGAFLERKVALFVTTTWNGSDYAAQFSRTSDDVCTLFIENENAANTDDYSGVTVEIRVYPS